MFQVCTTFSFLSFLLAAGFQKTSNQYSAVFAASIANSLYILIPSTIEYCHKAIMVVSGKSSLVKYCLSCLAILFVVDIPFSSNAFVTFTAGIGGLNSMLCGGFMVTSTLGGTAFSSVLT